MSDKNINEEINDTEIDKNNDTNLSLNNNTKCVVTIDGIPYCYTNNIEDAREKMWNFARLKSFSEHYYTSYIEKYEDPNKIKIIGCYKFSIIPIYRTLYYLECIS